MLGAVAYKCNNVERWPSSEINSTSKNAHRRRRRLFFKKT
jgi:hypothetical protein